MQSPLSLIRRAWRWLARPWKPWFLSPHASAIFSDLQNRLAEETSQRTALDEGLEKRLAALRTELASWMEKAEHTLSRRTGRLSLIELRINDLTRHINGHIADRITDIELRLAKLEKAARKVNKRKGKRRP